MLREIDRFECEDDHGKRHVVVIFQDFAAAGVMGNPHQQAAGLKSARFRNGSPLNRIDDRTFQDPASGLIVRRIE